MTPLATALIVFSCVFLPSVAGVLLNRYLPDQHLSKDTQDVVRLAAGVIATMAALILGLLVAASKNSLDVRDGEVKQLAADIILLDRQLAHYGDPTKELRTVLRRYTIYKVDATWTSEAASPADPHGWKLLEDIQDQLRALTPATPAQQWLQTRALEVSGQIAQARWLLEVQQSSSISTPFLVILTIWLSIVFASFGLFAPRNTVSIAALLLCSLSVAGSIYLVLEMDQPFEGLIHVSSWPMRDALAQLGA